MSSDSTAGFAKELEAMMTIKVGPRYCCRRMHMATTSRSALHARDTPRTLRASSTLPLIQVLLGCSGGKLSAEYCPALTLRVQWWFLPTEARLVDAGWRKIM